MEIYIVFEYAEPTNKIAGIYKNPEDAEKKQKENPTYRYIQSYQVE